MAKETKIDLCPDCGSPEFRSRALGKYHYRESGLPNVWLHGGGVISYHCESCGRRSIAVQREPQLLQVIAVWLLMRPGGMRGYELRYLRRACGLTQEALAAKLDVLRGAVVNWEAGEIERTDRSRMLHLRMVLLREFRRALSEEGNDHLAQEHRDRLAEFQQRFAAEFGRLIKKPKRVSATIEKGDDAWRLPDAA